MFTLLPADPPPPPTDVAGADEEDGNLRVSNISPNKLFCIVVLSTKLLDVEELDVLFIVLLELLEDWVEFALLLIVELFTTLEFCKVFDIVYRI